jgi:Anti-sigma-K factor rskA
MDRGPDFRELVGDDLAPEERARLERVHELLVAAGPPPELPPALAEPPSETPTASIVALPRRRAGAMLALAAAIALIAFLGGFVAGKHGVGNNDNVIHSVAMHGTGSAQNASAKIDIEAVDSGGNWPLRVVVHGLKKLPKGSYYEMFLTKHGKPLAACGIFTVSGDTSTVHLAMPPTLRGYDGWIVTREGPGQPHQVVLTT